jgi:hypothetical protein
MFLTIVLHSCARGAADDNAVSALSKRDDGVMKSLQRSQDLLTVSCMKKQGFPGYQLPAESQSPFLLLVREYANATASQTLKKEASLEEKALTSSVRVGSALYQGGCQEYATNEALRRNTKANEVLARRRQETEIVKASESDARWLPVRKAWTRCMTEKGFPNSAQTKMGTLEYQKILAKIRPGMSEEEIEQLEVEETALSLALSECNDSTISKVKAIGRTIVLEKSK